MRALLLFFLAAGTLFGQSALYVDLTGTWHRMRGDQPAFANADFDDSQWPTAELPRQQLPKYSFTWFRRKVDLPSWADSSRLAITIGSVAESYEVYINGKLIGKAGGFRVAQTYVARPRTFQIPADLAIPGANLTIALRVWRPDFVVSTARNTDPHYFPDDGPYLLTYSSNAPSRVAAGQMLTRERFATSSLIVAEFEGVLALILLAGWLSQRQRKDLILLVGFLLCECWVRLYEYVAVVGDWPHLTNATASVALFAGSLFLTYLAAAATGMRLRWLTAYAWLELSVFLLDNVIIAWTESTTQTALIRNFSVYGTSMSLVDTATACSLFFWLWKTWRKTRQAEPRVWFVLSIAILALLRSQRGGSVSRVVNLIVTTSGYRWTLFDLATLVIALWITIYLVRGLGAAKQRLAGEMEAARAVQQLLLPASAQDWQGYDVQAEYRPAQEVGGDFYQFLARPDGSRIALLGDVSGKGLKAALLVSVAVGVLRGEAASSPAAILTSLNRALFGHTGGAFVTCCCVQFEPGGKLTVASAGHPAPYRAGNEIAMKAGLPLGVVECIDFPEVSFALAPGDQITLVSDGVFEAAGTKGELFGFDRTREISKHPAAEIAEAAKSWGQNDDITVVTVVRAQ